MTTDVSWVNPSQPRNSTPDYYGLLVGDCATGSCLKYDPVDGLVINAAITKPIITAGKAVMYWYNDGVTDFFIIKTSTPEANPQAIALKSDTTYIVQNPVTSGTPGVLSVQGAAHTGIASAQEIVDIGFILNRDVRHLAGSMSGAFQRAVVIQSPTYSFNSAESIGVAVGLYVDAPTAGLNATFLKQYALYADGNVAVIGNMAITGVLTAGSISGGSITPANPTASVGLAAVNGSAASFMRSDAAPPLNQGIVPTWTGKHIHNADVDIGGVLNFTGTGRRITGNLSAATKMNRLMFQTSVAASFTKLGLIPSAGGTVTSLNLYVLPDADNSEYIGISSGTTHTIGSSTNGTGTMRPLAIQVNNGTTAALFTVNGAVLIGKTTPAGVDAAGNVEINGKFGVNGAASQAAYASGGALAAYGAGANGFDTGANASALYAMVVAMRAALVANGVLS